MKLLEFLNPIFKSNQTLDSLVTLGYLHAKFKTSILSKDDKVARIFESYFSPKEIRTILISFKYIFSILSTWQFLSIRPIVER